MSVIALAAAAAAAAHSRRNVSAPRIVSRQRSRQLLLLRQLQPCRQQLLELAAGQQHAQPGSLGGLQVYRHLFDACRQRRPGTIISIASMLYLTSSKQYK